MHNLPKTVIKSYMDTFFYRWLGKMQRHSAEKVLFAQGYHVIAEETTREMSIGVGAWRKLKVTYQLGF